MIEGKSRREISNAELYAEANIPPLQQKITEATDKFFTERVKRNVFTRGIGTMGAVQLPANPKRKLIYYPN